MTLAFGNLPNITYSNVSLASTLFLVLNFKIHNNLKLCDGAERLGEAQEEDGQTVKVKDGSFGKKFLSTSLIPNKTV